MLLPGGTLNAPADNDVHDNITRHPRGDDVLQADSDDGSQMLGAPQSGTPTSQAYKGWHARTGLALQPHGARARDASSCSSF
jgi:hypothetical protein